MTRDYDYEEKVNKIYKKVREGDSERFDEVKKNIDKAFEWTEGINDAYKKIISEQKVCSQCASITNKPVKVNGEIVCQSCAAKLKEEKLFENEKGAEKMIAALEKKSGKKYSPEEREKLMKKFMKNMK